MAAYRDQKKSRGRKAQPHIAALGMPVPLVPAQSSSLALALSPPRITVPNCFSLSDATPLPMTPGLHKQRLKNANRNTYSGPLAKW